MSVILIEENPRHLAILTQALRRNDIPVVGYSNAKEALRHLNSSSNSILLSDIDLKSISGYEICHMSKNLFPKLKVILFSNEYSPDMLIRSTKTGADHLFLTPLPIKRISQIIKNYLSHKDKRYVIN